MPLFFQSVEHIFHYSGLGRYYSNDDENKSQNADIDNHYPKLLTSYEEPTVNIFDLFFSS